MDLIDTMAVSNTVRQHVPLAKLEQRMMVSQQSGTMSTQFAVSFWLICSSFTDQTHQDCFSNQGELKFSALTDRLLNIT